MFEILWNHVSIIEFYNEKKKDHTVVSFVALRFHLSKYPPPPSLVSEK